MKEFGEIASVQGEYATILVKRSGACSKCGACELGSNNSNMFLKAKNVLNGKPGDIVELELPASQFLEASVIVYLFPLLGLILGVGYFVGTNFGINAQLSAAVSGILFTAIVFIIIRIMEPHFKKSKKFSPVIVNIIKSDEKGEY